MPVLSPEPFIHPEQLFGEDEAPQCEGSRWWVLHTRPRAEKSLARKLRKKDASFFLPLFPRNKRPANRSPIAQLPLFPGYLFLHGDDDARLLALETNLVARCLPTVDSACLHADLARVFKLMHSEAPLHPENRLHPGALVEIIDGPLAGLTGKVIRRGKQLRFIVEVDLLQRGVSVELDRWMFQPVDG